MDKRFIRQVWAEFPQHEAENRLACVLVEISWADATEWLGAYAHERVGMSMGGRLPIGFDMFLKFSIVDFKGDSTHHRKIQTENGQIVGDWSYPLDGIDSDAIRSGGAKLSR